MRRAATKYLPENTTTFQTLIANMFDPPREDKWYSTDFFDETYVEAYKKGYEHHSNGGRESDNPHELSGHERDTTYSDELHYWWYKGFNDFES
jgi:hypothetical protein